MSGPRKSQADCARPAARRGSHTVLRESRRLFNLGCERGVLRPDAARNDGGWRLRDAELQFSASNEQAGAVLLERGGVVSALRCLRAKRTAADRAWRAGDHRYRVRPWPPGRRDHGGFLAALVLATSPRLLFLSRRIIIDVHVTMWMGLVLLCFALSEVRLERRRLYLLLMYVAAGLGVLTKGLWRFSFRRSCSSSIWRRSTGFEIFVE